MGGISVRAALLQKARTRGYPCSRAAIWSIPWIRASSHRSLEPEPPCGLRVRPFHEVRDGGKVPATTGDEMTAARSAPVEWVRTPGLVPYEAACALMAERVDAIAAGSAAELVWLLEHPPLYTAGTSAQAGRPDRARAVSRASHRPRRAVHLSRARASASSIVMLDVRAAGGDVRAYVAALEALIIEALAALGRGGAHAQRSGRRLGAPARGGPRAGGQDRRHRRAAAPLGELARLQHQRGARSGALLRHRALRHPRRGRDEPCRTGIGMRASRMWIEALRRAFEHRYRSDLRAPARRRRSWHSAPSPMKGTPNENRPDLS